MRKCIIIPDSFKGTMSSQEVCSIIEKSVKEHYPQCDVTSIPVADGGEGTVDCFLASMQGERCMLKWKMLSVKISDASMEDLAIWL